MTYLRWPKWCRVVVVEVEDEERVHEEEKRSQGRRWADFVAERTVSHHPPGLQSLLTAGRWRTLRHGPGHRGHRQQALSSSVISGSETLRIFQSIRVYSSHN